jgi:small neutral amino acid transporter SnatA (MarC family)
MTDPTVPDQTPVPPTPPAAPYNAGPAKPSTVLSLLSMIGGIVGLVLSCCFGAGFLFAVAGIVLGFLGKKKEDARGMGMTGIITGFVGVALAIIMWVLLLAAPAMLSFLPWTSYTSSLTYP